VALVAILSLAALDQLLRLGDDEAARGPDWAVHGGCAAESITGQMNYSYRSILYIISQLPDGDAAEPRPQACKQAGSPDWLADAEKVPLRGSL
jgi:hypothetical protein